MSLATRCPACGTIFRVVQDQLKVSEGWVRCGQCHEVFHGIESLFDLGNAAALAPRPAAGSEPTSAPGLPDGFSAGSAPGPAQASAQASPPAPALPRGMSPGFAARVAARMAAEAMSARPDAALPDTARPAAIGGAPEAAFATTLPAALAPAPELPEVPESEREHVDLDLEVAPEPAAAPGAHVLDAPPEPAALAGEALAREALTGAALTGAAGREAANDATLASREMPLEPAPEADEIIFAEPLSAPPLPPHPWPHLRPPLRPGPAPDEDDADEEARAGPQTLASMLPEPVGDWPPRGRRVRTPPAARSHPADPRFVREARLGERWSRPWVRAVLGLAAVLLLLAAGAQLAYPWRDTIASRWPATLPAWEAACETLGCTVEAPRALASLTLDASSLTRTDTDHVLLFAADLHNRSDHAVRMPSFDLSFTDLNGQIVARKVLEPGQLGIAQAALGPDAELHVHARLRVAATDADASGFQAEMFYP